MDTSLLSQAQRLIDKVARQCTTGQAHGFMSASVYDTAWLSMLRNPADTKSWLFPECYDFVLQNQMPCGAWESYSTEVDGILNTAAALLVIKKHLKEYPSNQDWILRSQKAEAALKLLLSSWDVGRADQVGFEILVIKHLSLLEGEGMSFDFPGLTILRALHDAKLAKLPASTVYKARSTLHHSLEAFADRIEFDKLKCWLEENGSMLASPSSTAAYLMYSSTWDERAESYLRDTLMYGTGKRDGGVPPAWPTTIFETAWVITTLMEAGIPVGKAESSIISSFLEEALVSNNGVVGFAPSTLPDADDTAKVIATLHYLGRTVKVEPLLETFDADGHFRTYQGERNPGFSANCNVLRCLMMLEDSTRHRSQIARATSFLCEQAFDASVKEKWHTHELYWMMLLSQAFVQFFRLVQDKEESFGQEVFTQEPKLRQYIPMVSLQIVMNTLNSQALDGSWDDICEVTAYAVLTLSSMIQLPWVQELLNDNITQAIHQGKSFLEEHRDRWDKGYHLWIEKVTYASDILSETYCLAAIITLVTPCKSQADHSFSIPTKMIDGVKKAMGLISQTPLLSSIKPEALRTAESLAAYALWFLQHEHLEIFPHPANGKIDHKYQVFTPVIWFSCSVIHGSVTSLRTLCEMITFSIIIYQVDEYMEAIIERDFAESLPLVDTLVRKLCREMRAAPDANYRNGYDVTRCASNELASEEYVGFGKTESVLRNFIGYVLHHKAVLNSPQSLQQALARELETFLAAHITQAIDNQQFAIQQGATSTPTEQCAITSPTLLQYSTMGRTFYNWVRSTSADHTSCPFSFIFYICLISKPSSSIFRTARSAYLAEDLCRHLASLCRMYNDYGSVTRDREEGNLNSVNFPEFHIGVDGGRGKEREIKDELMRIAEYERGGLERAIKALGEELGDGNSMDALKIFIDVTDLYGQIYVQRDLTARNR